MIDKSLPKYPLYLYKKDTKQYPKYELPSGYTIEFYKKGDEVHWANLECSIGQFETLDAGLKSFENSFVKNQTLSPEDRMMFVKDADGEYVATCALWDGLFCGEKHQRLHWLAVSDKCTGKGIAKCLVSKVFELYNNLGYDGFIYLMTGTWYYNAIGIYKSFGFEEYHGPRSLTANMSDEEFTKQSDEAWKLVNMKLNDYAKSKK